MSGMVAYLFIIVGAAVSTLLTWGTYRTQYAKTRWLRMTATVTSHIDHGEGVVALGYSYLVEGRPFSGKSQVACTGYRSIPVGSTIGILVDPADPRSSDKDVGLYAWYPLLVFLSGMAFIGLGLAALHFPDGWP